MRGFQSSESIVWQRLTPDPEIGPERTLELALETTELAGISVDRQKQRPVAPLLADHGTRLSIELVDLC